MRSSKQEGQLIYHGHSSADFGIYVEYPLTLPQPEADTTVTHINGRSGDLIQNYQSFKNITLTVNVEVYKPKQYDNLYQLQYAIRDWLIGYDYDYLKFDDNPEWLWEAQGATATLTPLIEPHAQEELSGTITFNCKPLMKRTDGIHWQAVPNIDIANDVWSTVLYNQTNMICYPDWHLQTDGKGIGNWNIIVNGQICGINGVEKEIYIDGENCQAFQSPDFPLNLNGSVTFWNNDAPFLVPGKNTIDFMGNDLGPVEFKPNWRRLA